MLVFKAEKIPLDYLGHSPVRTTFSEHSQQRRIRETTDSEDSSPDSGGSDFSFRGE